MMGFSIVGGWFVWFSLFYRRNGSESFLFVIDNVFFSSSIMFSFLIDGFYKTYLVICKVRVASVGVYNISLYVVVLVFVCILVLPVQRY